MCRIAFSCLNDLLTYYFKIIRPLHQTIPGGLVVRIPRFHRGGRGSIPRLGEFFVLASHLIIASSDCATIFVVDVSILDKNIT